VKLENFIARRQNQKVKKKKKLMAETKEKTWKKAQKRGKENKTEKRETLRPN
jgi:hypothetical protein